MDTVIFLTAVKLVLEEVIDPLVFDTAPIDSAVIPKAAMFTWGLPNASQELFVPFHLLIAIS